MIDLSTTYMGFKLKNPIIAGSSGLTDSVEKIIELEKSGAAAVVLRSIFEEEILVEMNARLKQMNSAGFVYPETVDEYAYYDDAENESSYKYLQLIRQAKAAVRIPIFASINCVSAKNWTFFPKQIEDAGADAIELNLFILPTDFARSGTDNEKVYFDIVAEVQKQVSIPVSIKISYYFSNLGKLIQEICKTNIQGLVMFNRFYSPDIDIEKLEITSGHVLSSPSDMAISLRWIAIMAGRVNCDLVASTGINSGKDVVKQILAGAKAVQVASSLYRNGPKHIEYMLDELKNWMGSKNYSSIAEFRAMLSQKNTENPAAYERVQFMKYFRGYKG